MFSKLSHSTLNELHFTMIEGEFQKKSQLLIGMVLNGFRESSSFFNQLSYIFPLQRLRTLHFVMYKQTKQCPVESLPKFHYVDDGHGK